MRYVATIRWRCSLSRWHPAARCAARVCLATALAAAVPVAAQTGGARAGPGRQAGPVGALHVASPDWREQIIYFVMTDRFADADPSNNDQGAGEFDPQRNSHYSGGDLRGLRARLAYIQGLGATAVWITPPVANQWLEGRGGHTGYHGYWAEHFKRVDKHLGTLADLRDLSRALHGRGMYLVQDIVVNHTGNFFGYAGGWDPANPTRFYRANEGSRPVRPSQPPFDLNDPRRLRDRLAGIYHWTPAINDYNDAQQVARFQMSGLDDLATGNPRVRRALRDSYGWWIRRAGVDAFRVDTAFYVPPEDLRDFLHARDARAPGILHAARRTGRRDFLVFGEGFGIDQPFADEQARKIEGYMTDARGRPLMGGMLNFPLYGSLTDVFARGEPTARLAHRIERGMSLHARPHRMANFIDNHDVDRFLAGASSAALRQALLAVFALPGIPVIYYGTEQGFVAQRASMFAGGFGSGGRDHFDAEAPLYRSIAALSALRRSERAFTHGSPQVLARSTTGPGVLAWRMGIEGRPPVFIVLNTADHEVLLDKMPTGLAPGTRLEPRFSLEALPAAQRVGADGHVSLALPARAGFVWQADVPARAGEAAAARAPAAEAPAAPSIDALPAVVEGDFGVSGSAGAARALRIVVDGDLSRASSVQPDAAGRWSARVDTAAMFDAAEMHEIVAWDAQTGAISPTGRFRVQRAWQRLADVEDPAGDDNGPDGRYRYPTDPSFAAQRSMDLQRVQVFGSAGALRLDLTMAGLARSWNPPNGFDHLALTVFVELPQSGEPGLRAMPQQNAELPDGMRWHRRLRVHGWSNALFSSAGASAVQEGTPVVPGARIGVDPRTRTISLTLPAAALGHLSSLSGVKLYVTSWDYDGGYRELASEASGFAIGGGDPARGARVMDASRVIVLP